MSSYRLEQRLTGAGVVGVDLATPTAVVSGRCWLTPPRHECVREHDPDGSDGWGAEKRGVDERTSQIHNRNLGSPPLRRERHQVAPRQAPPGSCGRCHVEPPSAGADGRGPTPCATDTAERGLVAPRTVRDVLPLLKINNQAGGNFHGQQGPTGQQVARASSSEGHTVTAKCSYSAAGPSTWWSSSVSRRVLRAAGDQCGEILAVERAVDVDTEARSRPRKGMPLVQAVRERESRRPVPGRRGARTKQGHARGRSRGRCGAIR